MTLEFRRICFSMVAIFVFIAVSVAAHAADEPKHRPTHFPNTEQLRSDEMRITALGTGMPTPLTRAQKSTAWLVELGNGDIFLFDIGTGSMENLFGLRPDFSRIDKIFLSHLHSDHFGDLDAFIVGSWLSGRYTHADVVSRPSASTPPTIPGGCGGGRAWRTQIRI